MVKFSPIIFSSAVVLCLAWAGLTHAQDTLAEPKVEVKTVFPTKSQHRITNLERNSVLIEVENHDERRYQVERIRAYLYDPEDFTKPLRTLEPARFTTQLPEKGTVKLPYRFTPLLEVDQVALTIEVEFSDKTQGNSFTLAAFNGTVTMAEPSTLSFDPQLWSIYLFIVGLVAGVGYWAKFTYVDGGAKKGGHPSVVTLDGPAQKNDWLPVQTDSKKGKHSRAGKKKQT
ncbi:Increased recombination centers protein 22 [Dispira simplex]|nr:Increased recombination centers protein 22 [Dispira simplex]